MTVGIRLAACREDSAMTETTTSANAAGKRCGWAGTDPLYIAYHDDEWGRPGRDTRALFELLCLEGMQAGLAWITVLRKRAHMRNAFAGFDPEQLARWGDRERAVLLADAGIIRHAGKIDATIGNARALLALESGSADAAGRGFKELLWEFVDGRPIVNRYRTLAEVPGSTPASHAMARTLKRLGFRFVGPTTCYAFMQAAGLVNDHLLSCPQHAQCAAETEQRA